ncbi:Uncharacterised protein [Collinsella intestinalis]|nr:Uncharacterised protein [Collinsella intestinalis]
MPARSMEARTRTSGISILVKMASAPWASSAAASGSRRVRASQAPRAAMLTASAGAPSSPAADGRDACK